MKTKNMRKKALLSSVAMLLVAVVALSGATYAWFASNKTAKLNTIELTTSKQSALQIAEGSVSDTTAPAATAYSAELVADWEQELKPVSTADCEDFFVVTALQTESADGSAQKADAVTAADSGDYLHKVIYFKADQTVSVRLTSLTPTASGTSLANALRVALVAGGTTTMYSINDSSVATKAIVADNGYVSGSKTFADFYAGNFDTVTFANQTTIAAGASSSAFVTLTDGAPTRVEVYIWLEGNDADCNNGMSGGALSNLAFQFDVVGA